MKVHTHCSAPFIEKLFLSAETEIGDPAGIVIAILLLILASEGVPIFLTLGRIALWIAVFTPRLVRRAATGGPRSILTNSVIGIPIKQGRDFSDRDVAEVAFQKRRVQSNGTSDFLPPHLQRVVAVSCVLRSNDGIRHRLGRVEREHAVTRGKRGVHPGERRAVGVRRGVGGPARGLAWRRLRRTPASGSRR